MECNPNEKSKKILFEWMGYGGPLRRRILTDSVYLSLILSQDEQPY